MSITFLVLFLFNFANSSMIITANKIIAVINIFSDENLNVKHELVNKIEYNNM